MDCVILAGGYGTRLRDVWDGPKCLVPIEGEPVIQRIIKKLIKLPELNLEMVFLVLGHKSSQVTDWIKKCPEPEFKKIHLLYEATPSGTANALRTAFSLVASPVLILNGDTLPNYDLKRLVKEYKNITPHPRMLHAIAAWYKGKYAGTAILSREAIEVVTEGKASDFDFYLASMFHYEVSGGYLDIGTPEAFYQAQSSNVLPIKEPT